MAPVAAAKKRRQFNPKTFLSIINGGREDMTDLEASHEPRLPVMRCPYCIEGGNFKVMIGRGGLETLYICARCGHKTLPTSPLSKCTCVKCVELKNRDPKTRG